MGAGAEDDAGAPVPDEEAGSAEPEEQATKDTELAAATRELAPIEPAKTRHQESKGSSAPGCVTLDLRGAAAHRRVYSVKVGQVEADERLSATRSRTQAAAARVPSLPPASTVHMPSSRACVTQRSMRVSSSG
jgi:hypothetical protein